MLYRILFSFIFIIRFIFAIPLSSVQISMAAKLAFLFSHNRLFCKPFRAFSLNLKAQFHIRAQNKSDSSLGLPQIGGGISLKVLFEDPWLLAVDKPPRLLVHRCKEANKQESTEKLFVKDIAEQQLTEGLCFQFTGLIVQPVEC